MEKIDLGRFVLSFAFVLMLIGGAAWLALKSGLSRKFAQRSSFASRLSVVDKLTIDPRHRLVLVRRDGREHLILLGASHALLLESLDAKPDHDAAV